MKRVGWLGLAVLAIGFLTGCNLNSLENEFEEADARNAAEITTYARNNNLTLTNSALGVAYQITRPNPAGRTLKEGEQATIFYKLSLLDGTVLDTALVKPARIGFYNGAAFTGFLDAMFQLKEGEKGVFFIPSSLAFANRPPAGIPQWAVIRADIEALKYQNEVEQILEHVRGNNLNITTVTSTNLHLAKTLAVATGDSLRTGDRVVVKYKGSFLDNTSFDSGDFTMLLGAGTSIKGFEEGVRLLKVGEKGTILFPSEIGYGKNGSGRIPPYAPLKFEIEILSRN